MRSKLAVLATAFSLVLPLALAQVAGAAKIQTNHDPAADFKSYKTYRWNKAEGPGGAGLDRPVEPAHPEQEVVLDHVAAGLLNGVEQLGR